jgi:hypothetical protein
MLPAKVPVQKRRHFTSSLMFDLPNVLVVGTNPDPNIITCIIHCESAMIEPDPHGPEFSSLLKMQRRMRRVFFQEFEVLPGDSLDSFWQMGK